MATLGYLSTTAVHRVCDATHALLAASPSREAEWSGFLPRLLALALHRSGIPDADKLASFVHEVRLADGCRAGLVNA